MILDYGTQISFEPIQTNIGVIKKPRLKDISKISFITFQLYENTLKLNSLDYCRKCVVDLSAKEVFDTMTDDEISKLSIFFIIKIDDYLKSLYVDIFNFFFEESVTFENDVFVLTKNEEVTGIIDEQSFGLIVELLQQLCCIYEKKKSDYKNVVFKNKAAELIYQKIEHGKKKQKEEKANNKDGNDYSLPNIISAVSNRHPSLNYLNIFELTVFQLMDAFKRLYNNEMQDIFATSVSVWGNSNNEFNSGLWHINIYDKDDLLD